MNKYPSLDKYARRSEVASSQQFYNTDLVEAEIQDANVKSVGEQISTLPANKLDYIITHFNKLITDKVESASDVSDAAEFNKIKGYVAGLKDAKRLFEDALKAKTKQ